MFGRFGPFSEAKVKFLGSQMLLKNTNFTNFTKKRNRLKSWAKVLEEKDIIVSLVEKRNNLCAQVISEVTLDVASLGEELGAPVPQLEEDGAVGFLF